MLFIVLVYCIFVLFEPNQINQTAVWFRLIAQA